MVKIYSSFLIMSFGYMYIMYLIQFLLDTLLLSVVGYLLSKITSVKFKYKNIFKMSVYAMTLSIILLMLYMIVNLYNGFTIKYFEIAYNSISYIYIITAMLMIKSDLIKQQIMVGEIKKVQEDVKKEQKENEDVPQKEKKEKDKKEEKSDKKSKGNKEKKDKQKNNLGEPKADKA